MSYCDDQYTKTPKPSAPSYTTNAKPTASYTITAKTTASYTETPKPCLELLALLTESGIEILHEDSRVMVLEGAI